MSKKLDDTVELDSTTEDTIVLDDSKDHTVNLVSSDEEEEQNYVTASNTRFLDNTTPPKITSTPNVEQRQIAQTSLFQEVEDEFLHDDSMPDEAAVTAHEKSVDEDSAIESETPEKAPVESTRQKSSDVENEAEESSVSEQEEIEHDEDTDDEKEEDDEEDDEEEGGGSLRRRTVDLDSLDLPETCTLLTTNKGAKVFLIGTAHFSKESQTDVSQVMRAVQPDIVVLELCKSRTNILHMDEETILSESQNLTTQKAVRTFFFKVQGQTFTFIIFIAANDTRVWNCPRSDVFADAINVCVLDQNAWYGSRRRISHGLSRVTKNPWLYRSPRRQADSYHVEKSSSITDNLATD